MFPCIRLRLQSIWSSFGAFQSIDSNNTRRHQDWRNGSSPFFSLSQSLALRTGLGSWFVFHALHYSKFMSGRWHAKVISSIIVKLQDYKGLLIYDYLFVLHMLLRREYLDLRRTSWKSWVLIMSALQQRPNIHSFVLRTSYWKRLIHLRFALSHRSTKQQEIPGSSENVLATQNGSWLLLQGSSVHSVVVPRTSYRMIDCEIPCITNIIGWAFWMSYHFGWWHHCSSSGTVLWFSYPAESARSVSIPKRKLQSTSDIRPVLFFEIDFI